MTNREKLNFLYQYYAGCGRQLGHSTVMMKGAETQDCNVLVHNNQMGRMLGIHPDDIVSLSNLSKLISNRKPLAVDNAALFSILDMIKDELDENKRLVEENKRLEHKLETIGNIAKTV